MHRLLAATAAFLVTQTPAWAHGAEELGHHWEIPAYRIEMMTQIGIMTAIAVAVVAGLWLKEVVRKRRARQ